MNEQPRRPTLANGINYRLKRQKEELTLLERVKDLENAVAAMKRIAWIAISALVLAATAGALKLLEYL